MNRHRLAPLRLAWLAALLASIVGCGASSPVAPAIEPELGRAALTDERERPAAPPLEGGTVWLNVDHPLTLEELRGHVVVLDFWTYACINCLHVLPELERLERRFAGRPVVVVGVHSGKFDAEKDPDRIQAAMRRHGVHHPVVVDSDFRIWRSYDVHAWPTLVVIDPNGRIVAKEAGEPSPGALGDLVGVMLEHYARDGRLADERISIEAPPLPDTGPLAFPGKLAVAADGRIAVADSGHHRVVVLEPNGEVADVVGSGIAGSADGAFSVAAFRLPQGLAFSADGRRLWVADTDNHELREIDFATRVVRTIAGTGSRGVSNEGGAGLATPLRSPWDLAYRSGELFVAMAGSHQIWRHDLSSGTIEPFAGTGRESIDDGALDEATFSQPSGLSLAGDTLYVADAEVSAIRAVDLKAGRVRTLVGKGLFEFGDVDGGADRARLQHALGVVVRGDQLYVADTFNNKLKRLDPATRLVESATDGADGTLAEPGGLALLDDGSVLVADTNNHRLRRFDPASGLLEDFVIAGLEPPTTRGLVLADGAHATTRSDGHRVSAAGKLGPGNGTLVIDIAPPLGGKLADGAPLVVVARATGSGVRFPQPKVRAKFGQGTLPIQLPIEIEPGASGQAELELSYFWCTTGDSGACIPVDARVRVDLDLTGVTPGGQARLTHRAKPETP